MDCERVLKTVEHASDLLGVLLQDGLQGVKADGEDVQQGRKVLSDVFFMLKQNLAEQAEGHFWARKGLPPAGTPCLFVPAGFHDF